jgi:UTP--glucose-1-phosphate uridylyltransferase
MPVTIPDAVVPVAGLGTRLLPATKSQPKEMLPVGGKPVVQHVVEELGSAGVERVLFVTGRGKNSIEDHFDRDAELIRILRETGREELLAELEYEHMGLEYLYTRQRQQRGLADAVLCAEGFTQRSPFVLALGDSIVGQDGGEQGRTLRALTDAFTERGAACAVAVSPVPGDEAHRYGVVSAVDEGDVFGVAGLEEKPRGFRGESALAISARYAFAPEIFDAIRATPADAQGEVQLTDAMGVLLDRGLPVIGVRLADGERRFDAGTPEGYAETFLEFAFSDPRLGARLRDHARLLLHEDRPR